MSNSVNNHSVSRRNVLLAGIGGAGVAAASTALTASPAVAQEQAASSGVASSQRSVNTIVTRDGVEIYYKDWGPKDGPVVILSHGWPLSSDAWDQQMLFFGREHRNVASCGYVSNHDGKRLLVAALERAQPADGGGRSGIAREMESSKPFDSGHAARDNHLRYGSNRISVIHRATIRLQ